MRHSSRPFRPSRAIVGLFAVLVIVSVQSRDMRHGTRHSYARALNDVNTDDGQVFDTDASASFSVRTTQRSRKSAQSR